MSIFKYFCCGTTSHKRHKSEPAFKINKLNTTSHSLQVKIHGSSKMGIGNRKTHCQDTFCIMENFTANCHFMAVYDGHGRSGLDASLKTNYNIEKYLKDNSEKIERAKTDKEFQTIIKKAFRNTEAIFKALPFEYTSSGTCCITVLIQNNQCFIANLGDSKGILCRQGTDSEIQVLELTKDHKPSNIEEKKRIIKMGGKVRKSKYHGVDVGPFRVWGNEEGPGIAVSRSLGDLRAKEIGVICDPEIEKVKLEEGDKYVVIGSDGLWDLMEVDEVAMFIQNWDRKGNNREKCSEALIREARNKWEKSNGGDKIRKELEAQGLSGVNVMCDDITVLIAYLDFGNKEEKRDEKVMINIEEEEC